MTDWKFDPSAAKAGDLLFVSERRGWRSRQVSRWLVERVTPGGQIVCKREGAELRINKRGAIVGDNWSRSVVSPDEALLIMAELIRENAWNKVRDAGDALVTAARTRDAQAARMALDQAAQGIVTAGADETGTGSVPKG